MCIFHNFRITSNFGNKSLSEQSSFEEVEESPIDFGYDDFSSSSFSSWTDHAPSKRTKRVVSATSIMGNILQVKEEMHKE